MKRIAMVSVVCLAGWSNGCKKSTAPVAPVNNSYTQAAVQAGGTLNSDGSVTNLNGSITKPDGTVVPAAAGGATPAPATIATAPAPAQTAPVATATTAGPVPASPQPQPAVAPVPVAITAPSGTAVTIRTGQELSVAQDGVGTRFSGVLERPIVSHRAVVFERGTPVEGEVVASKRKGEFKGSGQLAVVITAIGKHTVHTTEYVQVDKGRGKRTGAFIGGGGGLGALIGGLAGGGKGALIGGLAGAGAGTAASTTGSKNVVIRPESVITVRLTEAVSR